MRLNKILLMTVAFAGMTISCKDQLDVKTNEPQASALATEGDLLAFAQGGVYRNGFVDLKYSDGVMGAFWGTGYHDLMADVVSAEAANVYINQIGCPETVTLGDGTVITNPGNPTHQPNLIRQANKNSNASQNPSFYEWAYMYALNNVANNIIKLSDQVTYLGDAETKAKVMKAWAYWWKGFAYFRIGSMYYAGIINDEANTLTGNGEYKSSADILAESEKNLAACEAILNGLTVNAAYTQTLGKLIPDFTQLGHGGVPDPAMWIRNINTLRARTILANTRVDAMTSQQWNDILTLTNAGILESDKVFTLRTNATADLFSPNSGFTSAKTTGDPKATATYKITERLIQDFQPGDLRFLSNFALAEDDDGNPSTWIGESSRGNAFNTRWMLVDGGDQETYPDTYVYSDRDPGDTEQFVAGSWEENELMKAEAMIYTGNIPGAVDLIDAVREYQGAGLDPIDPGIDEAGALEQLRSERRVGLLFRWVSFYDARRWGVIDPVSAGGGRKNAVVITKDGVIHNDATLDFQFLDYWDVPDNEIVYNPPAASAAPTTNPKN